MSIDFFIVAQTLGGPDIAIYHKYDTRARCCLLEDCEARRRTATPAAARMAESIRKNPWYQSVPPLWAGHWWWTAFEQIAD